MVEGTLDEIVLSERNEVLAAVAMRVLDYNQNLDTISLCKIEPPGHSAARSYHGFAQGTLGGQLMLPHQKV